MGKCKECGQEIPKLVILVAASCDSEIQPITQHVNFDIGSINYEEAGITLAHYLHGIMASGQFGNLLAELKRLE